MSRLGRRRSERQILERSILKQRAWTSPEETKTISRGPRSARTGMITTGPSEPVSELRDAMNRDALRARRAQPSLPKMPWDNN